MVSKEKKLVKLELSNPRHTPLDVELVAQRKHDVPGFGAAPLEAPDRELGSPSAGGAGSDPGARADERQRREREKPRQRTAAQRHFA